MITFVMNGESLNWRQGKGQPFQYLFEEIENKKDMCGEP